MLQVEIETRLILLQSNILPQRYHHSWCKWRNFFTYIYIYIYMLWATGLLNSWEELLLLCICGNRQLVVRLFEFYGISTIVGYLILNPFLYEQTVLFQTIQFSIRKEFSSIWRVGPYQVLPLRGWVYLGAMALKGYSAFLEDPALL